MSFYPSDQRCPRCQYPITPGAQTCGNCGLALTGSSPSPYGSEPPPPPPPSSPYGPPPGTGPYGGNSSYGSGTPGFDFTPPPPPPPTFTGSPPTYYPGGQPQPGFSGSAPAYAGSQPQPGFPTPGMQPPQPKRGSGARIAIIVLVVVVLIAGIGGAAYFLTRPKPTISVTSTYHQGTTPAGANTTTFTVSGAKFSGNSTITFLLDGQPAPDSQTSLSDGQGNVKGTLTVSANWGVGPHTLTARDGSNYTTQQGASIVIVNPGEAHTPGPNGAPPDDMSFLFDATVNAQDSLTGETFQPFTDHLSVTGGKVCNPDFDDGNPHNSTGRDANGNSFTETTIYACSGTYKGGQINYTETATKDVIAFTDGFTCTAQTPYVFEHLEGTFTDGKTINGTFSNDAVTYNCSDGKPQQIDPEKGTWTGTTK